MIASSSRTAASLLCALLFSAIAHANDVARPEDRNKPESPATKPPEQPQKPAVAASKALPTDEAANAAIDTGFMRWSAAWMFDRYLPGTARATDRGLKDGTYVIRGAFDFVRFGALQTIPFAAAFAPAKEGFGLLNLCYNDITSGMTACIDPSDRATLDRQGAAVMQSRQFLGSIVVLGLAAAMSAASDGETCVKRYTFFGEPYFECERR